MADLSGLFQNLGPTGGALMSGLTTGQDLVSSMQQDEMRKAQMDEILQRAAAVKEMAPLELRAKQQAIESADLKAKEDKAAYAMDVLGRSIPRLKTIQGPQRFAEYEKIFSDAGIPLDEADRKHMYAQNPDKFITDLESRHKSYLTSRPAYQQAIDVAREHSRSAMAIEGAREASRLKMQQEKGAAEKSLQQDLSGAKTYQTQAVVYGNHAAKARLKGDTEEAVRLETLAKQATVADLQARAAAGEAAAQAKLQQLGVMMGGQPTGGNLGTGTYNIPSGGKKPLSDY